MRIRSKKRLEVFSGHKPEHNKPAEKIKDPKQVTFRVPGKDKERFDTFIEENKLIKNAVLNTMFKEWLERTGL